MGFKGGNFLCDRLALLVGVGFKVDRQNDYKDNSINLNTGLRYYLFSKLYLSAELGYDKVWLREYSFTDQRNEYGFKIGIGVFF